MIEKKVSALKCDTIEIVMRDDAFYGPDTAPPARKSKTTKLGEEKLFDKDESLDDDLLYASS